VHITAPAELVLSAAFVQHASCPGCNDGYIVLNTGGGIPPYSLSWVPSIGLLSGDTLSNLPIGTYQFTLSDSNGCDTVMILMLGVVGMVESQPSFSFHVFPNPATESLTLQASADFSEVEVRNALGQLIYYSSSHGRVLTLSCRSFSPGMYFLSIRSGQHHAVRKFIKQ
jgi:hypothetical protein